MESEADGKRERAGLKRLCERQNSGLCRSVYIGKSDRNDRQQNEGYACKAQSDGRSGILLCRHGGNGNAGGNQSPQGELVDKGGSSLSEDLAARGGALCEALGQARNQRVIDAFLAHAPCDIGGVSRKLSRKLSDPSDDLVRIKADLLGQFLPLTRVNIAEAVFAADLHGDFDALKVDLRVRENARHIVERGKTHTAAGTDENGVILGVSVGADDKPVERDGIDECVNVLDGAAGIGSQQLNNVSNTGSAFILVFVCRLNGEGLAYVFLVDAPQSVRRAESVVAFDDDRDFIPEMHDFGVDSREPERARQLQAEVLVFSMAVELAGRRLEDVRGWNAA